MSRTVSIVILCEDRQHEAFARRFLERAGKGIRIQRVERTPAGRGSGEQFVRRRYAQELVYYRSKKHKVEQALLVLIDADMHTVAERIEQVELGCDEAGYERRGKKERVVFIIPVRNIETWFAYLDGAEVDEAQVKTYPKLDRESECQRHVDVLFDCCARGALREPAPASLQSACHEYRRLMR